jgi:hypothetical protein
MHEIEEERARTQAASQIEQTSQLEPDEYIVTAGAFHDENLAAEKLTILIDRGYDGILVAAEIDGVVVFELRIGPYDDLRGAEDAAEVLNEAFGLATGVMLLPGDRGGPRRSRLDTSGNSDDSDTPDNSDTFDTGGDERYDRQYETEMAP